MHHFGYICLVFAVLVSGCQRQEEPEPAKMPDFVSVSFSDVSADGVVLTASLSGDAGENKCGFEMYSESGEGTEYISASQGNTFTCTVNNLSPNTKFSFKAFLDNLREIRIYSGTLSFTTKKEDPEPEPGTLIAIEDPFLKKWIVARYDTDGDGEISQDESKYVDWIETNGDNIHSTKGIEQLCNLVSLQLGGTCADTYGLGNISEIDVSNNAKLTSIGLEGNRISHLDISNNKLLTYLSVSRNPLKEISLSNQRYLTLVGLSWTDIKSLDLRGLNLLDEIHLDGNIAMNELLLDNRKLRYLDCSKCALKTLDVSKCPFLNEMDCSDNPDLLTIKMSRAQAISAIRKDPHTQIEYVD